MWIDHQALFKPIAKASLVLRSGRIAETIAEALRLATHEVAMLDPSYDSYGAVVALAGAFAGAALGFLLVEQQLQSTIERHAHTLACT